MTSMPVLQNCTRCGEDAVLVTQGVTHLCRVRRSTKCRYYKPNKPLCERYLENCRTAVHPSAVKAIKAWNEKNQDPRASNVITSI